MSDILSRYHSKTSFNNWRYRSAFTCPSRSVSLNRTPRSYSWVSAMTSITATWGLSCSQCIELCQLTYPLKWKSTSSPNISSSQILCDLAFQKIEFGLLYLLHVIFVQNTVYLLRKKFLTSIIQYTRDFGSTISDAVFLSDLCRLTAILTSTASWISRATCC